MSKIFFSILFLCLGLNCYGANLYFKMDGKEVAYFSLKQFKKGELRGKYGVVKVQEKKIYNAFRGYKRIYLGFDFFKLLDVVYGVTWHTKKRIIFKASDNYQQISLIAKMQEAANDKIGLMAFTEKNRRGFTKIEKNGKTIDPGPFYLVWSNFKESQIATHADPLKWPYNLSIIEID